jgi:hypothetical protein
MSIQEKIEAQEKSIKTHLDELRNQLNEFSKNHKANPGGWQYLTALSYANAGITELNIQLKDLRNNSK